MEFCSIGGKTSFQIVMEEIKLVDLVKKEFDCRGKLLSLSIFGIFRPITNQKWEKMPMVLFDDFSKSKWSICDLDWKFHANSFVKIEFVYRELSQLSQFLAAKINQVKVFSKKLRDLLIEGVYTSTEMLIRTWLKESRQ